MGEKRLRGEPAAHEPPELEDTDKVPPDIVIRKEEAVEERRVGKKEEKKQAGGIVRETIRKIEDRIAPRFETVESTPVQIQDEEAMRDVQRDIERVEKALQTVKTEDVEELKERLGRLKERTNAQKLKNK